MSPPRPDDGIELDGGCPPRPDDVMPAPPGGWPRRGACGWCGRAAWTRLVAGIERCPDCIADWRASRGLDGE